MESKHQIRESAVVALSSLLDMEKCLYIPHVCYIVIVSIKITE